MKIAKVNIIIIVGIFYLSLVKVSAQERTLSEDERQRIVQEVLDSLRKDKKDISSKISDALSFAGYIETYYSYDFAEPQNQVRQPFVFSFNRHNEFTLNLGLVQLAYKTDKIRANLGLMAGAYSNDNLIAEEGVMRNVFEANIGFKLSQNKNLWLDAGIFASHIGFESAIGRDCWNLTRSILADNSPYYESGLKLSYTSDNEEWFLSALILNGWQRIYRLDGNNTPAFGHQITWTPSQKVTLNSSSFIGSDTPDSTRQMRYFHNLYGQFQLSEKFALIAGFDIGAQQESQGSEDYNTWYSPVLIMQYSPSEKVSLSARGEYYSDSEGVIIATGTPNGFQTWGYSLNLDYSITSNLLWRVEGRGFRSEDEIFTLDNKPSNNNFFVTSSLAISF